MASAQSASTPLKVQLRREKMALKSSKTSSQIKEAQASQEKPLVSTGRGRIRGVRLVRGPDGKKVEKIVGQRIYLPNIIFRMMRNNTPSGKPYNPYEATFRVPQSITKTDIRSYLLSVYGVECTYIRTDNYLPKVEKNPLRSKRRKSMYVAKSGSSAYKRAVVGLLKPFYYPLAVEDMNGKDRWLRETMLDETYFIEVSKQNQRELFARHTQKSSDDWKMRNAKWGTRRSILREIWRRKEEREARAKEAANLLLKIREEGKLQESSS